LHFWRAADCDGQGFSAEFELVPGVGIEPTTYRLQGGFGGEK